MKDVTVSLPPGLHIPVVCEREDPSDAFVSNRHASLDELERGARVGTCSLRRQCILRSMFPGLDVVNLRGNVNTRLKRLGDGDFDAIILATAGLKRLDMTDRIRARLATDLFVPAVGQGAVGIECRIEDGDTNRLIAVLDHEPSHVRVLAERAANRRLGGGCHVPLGVHARLDGGRLLVDALVGSPDGATVLRANAEGPVARAEAIGVAVAGKLLDQGAEDILRAVYAHG
jgi:hydroxymethylbilane synthase